MYAQLFIKSEPHSLTNLQHIQSGALRVCLESNIVEILRDAGPEVIIFPS